jgi:ABC-type iron transport system FetAB permease component
MRFGFFILLYYIYDMYNKLLKLDFGLQMLIVVFSLIITNQLTHYLLNLVESTDNKFSVLMSLLVMMITQGYIVYITIRLAIYHFKNGEE